MTLGFGLGRLTLVEYDIDDEEICNSSEDNWFVFALCLYFERERVLKGVAGARVPHDGGPLDEGSCDGVVMDVMLADEV